MSSISVSNVSVASHTPAADKAVKPLQAEPELLKPAEAVKQVTGVSKTELQQAVDVVNQAVALEQRSLSFSIDDVSGRSVIKVIDYETDELIKQIPSEELLKVAQDIKRLQEEMGQSIGLLIDSKV
ncbi:flagellar protein FlaG [Rheinheimera sp. EpRS3]|uniref:flagellar protein FlaG n=1 Tax=Rheinheimera sp. EpRS3 TaxID=1712383 RepID=UPI00074741DC|nr:flagellar protein FlaG [Rheinheimera sp. EpRS3]KUM52398.1 flagellar biosynthesis protein FlaG [Rheinheimera sp. EpRS3]